MNNINDRWTCPCCGRTWAHYHDSCCYCGTTKLINGDFKYKGE